MKIFENCKIITLDENNPYIEDGSILVENGRIIKIGETKKVRAEFPQPIETINLNNKIVLPGFLNAHMHLYSTFARGFGFKGAAPKTFKQILDNIWWKLDLKLETEDEIYYSAMIPIIEGIKSGTTAIIDHHASFGMVDGSLDIIEKAIIDSGIRGVLCFETSDRNGEDLRRKSIDENVRFINKKKNEDFVNGMFGLHASMTLSNKTLEESLEKVKETNPGFHIHVAEGPEDVEDSILKYKKRVVERLFDLGILGEKTIAVHCIHINEREINLLKETNTIVVHNPESNMNNAVGVAPVMEIDKTGIIIGLGTDGYTPSMIESVKVAYILPKLYYKDPQAGSLLAKKMLFENNHKIFSKFFKTEMGIIKEGAYADFVTLDYEPPTNFNENNFFFHLIFGIRENSICDVVVNGELILKDRIFTKFDEKEIFIKAREVSNKFWEKI